MLQHDEIIVPLLTVTERLHALHALLLQFPSLHLHNSSCRQVPCRAGLLQQEGLSTLLASMTLKGCAGWSSQIVCKQRVIILKDRVP